MPDRRTIAALCVVEEALYDCQYRGGVKRPAWHLRLALAVLYEVAGDDPGIAPKSREPFDRLWRLVTGIESVSMNSPGAGVRSTLAHTEYSRIRRMVGYPQTMHNDAEIERLRGRP